jgi:adenylate cyclase class 2
MEIEIKLRVLDRDAVLRLLRRLKCARSTRMHEMNTLYDTPNGALLQDGKLMRIRTARPAVSSRKGEKPRFASRWAFQPEAILTFKGPVRGASPDSRYKIREEHELGVDDSEAMHRILDGMGLLPWFRYEKYRTTFRLPRLKGLLIELDETPIGDFLELEGGSEAIDRAAAILGYGPTDYITTSYGQLFAEYRRGCDSLGLDKDRLSESKDMLFATRK